MSKIDFQNGFALGLASGGVVEVVDKAETEALEALIDESGVLDSTEGGVEDKVEQLIDLAEEATNKWKEDTSEVVAEYNAYQNSCITACITRNGTLTWKRNSVTSGPNQMPKTSWSNLQQAYNVIGEKYIDWIKAEQAEVLNVPDASGDKLITQLGNQCFASMLNLKRVRLPDTITIIGNSAFYDCRELRGVNLPDGVMSIGATCFAGCKKLEQFNLPGSVTSLNAGVFQNCDNLKQVTGIEQLISIGNAAFSGCIQLGDTVALGENIEDIAYDAFNTCYGLKKIYFKGVPNVMSGGAFRSCSSITDIYCPWAEGEVENAPWGATNATIHYNYVEGEETNADS